jgi:Bacterial Ig-like domain (group 3)
MFTLKTGKILVAAVFMGLLLFGSINFELPTAHAQSSSPSATLPFNGWLVPDGGQAQVPYDTEISLDPSSTSFTIEGWINNPVFSTTYNYQMVSRLSSFYLATRIVQRNLPLPITWFYRVDFCGTLGSIGCQLYGPVLSSCIAGTACVPTGWFHFAYVYDKPNNTWLFFWDGVKYAEVNETPRWSTEFLILSHAQQMDEFRISNDVRYSSNFTVPSDPFVCDANTLALWHFDEVQGATTFHDACGATDNVMTGFIGAHTEGVTGQATSTALVSSTNPSGVGRPVNFTVTVSGSGGTLTGTVAFKDGGTDITGCATQPLSSGQATCSTSSLTVTTHNITAVYSGDTIFASSTSPDLSQTVMILFDMFLPLITK